MAASHTNNGLVLGTTTQTKKQLNENDDDVGDSWEQLDYRVLEKRLQTIKIDNTNKNEENSIKNNKNNTILNTQSAPQPQQPIKILKRPPSNKQLNEQPAANAPPAQPIKTFEQREQEYAQARLRILGSAHPVEETTTTNSTVNAQAGVSSRQQFQPENNLQYNKNSPLKNQQQPPSSSSYSSSNNSNMNNMINNKNSNSYHNNNNNNNNNNVNNSSTTNNNVYLIREPICPDGTTGFNNRNNTSHN